MEQTAYKIVNIFGVFGKIDLEKLSYLRVISEVQSVGNFLNSKVYKVKKLLFLPINGDHPTKPAP